MSDETIGWLDILTYAAIQKITSAQLSSNNTFEFTSSTDTSVNEIMLTVFLISNYAAIIVLAVASQFWYQKADEINEDFEKNTHFPTD